MKRTFFFSPFDNSLNFEYIHINMDESPITIKSVPTVLFTSVHLKDSTNTTFAKGNSEKHYGLH